MAKLREVRAAMPKEFVESFQETADAYGMTPRQLAALQNMTLDQLRAKWLDLYGAKAPK